MYPASLFFAGSRRFTDADAEDLKGWSRLQELSLGRAQVTDADL